MRLRGLVGPIGSNRMPKSLTGPASQTQIIGRRRKEGWRPGTESGAPRMSKEEGYLDRERTAAPAAAGVQAAKAQDEDDRGGLIRFYERLVQGEVRGATS